MKIKSTFALVLALMLMFTATMSVNAALPSSMTWDSEGNVTFHDAPKPYVGDTELPPLNPGKPNVKLKTHEFDMNNMNVQRFPITATLSRFADLEVNAEWLEEDSPWANLTSGSWQTPETMNARSQDPDYTVYDSSGKNLYESRWAPRRAWMQNYLKVNGYDISGMLDSDKISIMQKFFAGGESIVEEFMHIGQPEFELKEIDGCVTWANAVEAVMYALDFEVFTVISSKGDWVIETGATGYGDGAHALTAYCEIYKDGTVSPPIFVDAYWDLWGLYSDELKDAGQTLGTKW